MFKGNNTLELNEATMIEIVQYWLDNKMLNPQEPSPTVKFIKGGGQYDNTFKITLEATAQREGSK